MVVGIAGDHGGFELKEQLKKLLISEGYMIKDFGAEKLISTDDYPDFAIPLAEAVSKKEVEKGIVVCGSGVGASIAANKVNGARAALITDVFSARQGVEDDDMNIIAIGGRVIGPSLAWELVKTFLNARFSGLERHQRRLSKVIDLELNKR